MKPWIFPVALLLLAMAGESMACTYQETPPDDNTRMQDFGEPAVTWVILDSMRPGDRDRINRETELEVDVTYNVKDIKPGEFFLVAHFPTTYGSMYVGSRADYPTLRAPQGRVHLCVPLAEVFDDPSVRWPLTVTISINHNEEGGPHRPIADSRMVAFSQLDAPAKAEALRAAAPPEEFVRALMRAASYLEGPHALSTVCSARFPEMKETFDRIYPAWVARNADTVDMVNTLQLEQFRMSGKYPEEVARQIQASVRSTIAKEYEKVPQGSLRESCLSATLELADPDNDINGAIGDELRIVRKWQASQPVVRP